MLWTDEHLVAGLKRRDSAAIEYAVTTYAPRLYRYALYELGDPAAADDLVAEVITRMWEKIDSYQYTSIPLQVWLFRIARNLLIDQYRQRRLLPVLSLEAWQEARVDHDVGAPDRDLEGTLDREVLRAAFAQLPDDQRQVAILRLVDGWQPSEIAELTGRSIDSVKSLQYRATQSLRRILGPSLGRQTSQKEAEA